MLSWKKEVEMYIDECHKGILAVCRQSIIPRFHILFRNESCFYLDECIYMWLVLYTMWLVLYTMWTCEQ